MISILKCGGEQSTVVSEKNSVLAESSITKLGASEPTVMARISFINKNKEKYRPSLTAHWPYICNVSYWLNFICSPKVNIHGTIAVI